MNGWYIAFVMRVFLENISAPCLLGERRQNYTDCNLVLIPSVGSLLVSLLALGPLVGNIENSMCELNATEPIRDLESNLGKSVIASVIP